MNYKLPNILTLSRVAIIPLLICLFYVQTPFSNLLMAFLFVLACITDFFDGYFARTLGQTSAFGRFLDPVADKLLITSTLFMLVGFHRIEGISLLPAVIILCREILVSGLREFLSTLKIGLPVSQLAKWKTAIQMISLIGLLIGDSGYLSIFGISFGKLGLIFLWFAGLLTLITGYTYLKEGLHYFKEHDF